MGNDENIPAFRALAGVRLANIGMHGANVDLGPRSCLSHGTLLKMTGDGALRAIYEKWGIWSDDTERLFAGQSKTPRKYEEYTQLCTRLAVRNTPLTMPYGTHGA